MAKKLRDLTILNGRTCDRVYELALKILREKGFRVDSPEMRARLRKAGASVDDARGVATLPPELVKEALAATPSEFDIHDLDGRPTRFAAGTALKSVMPLIETIQWLDYGAETLRASRLEDLKKALILADALPIAWGAGMIVCPTDVSPERQHKEGLKAILTTTRKSCCFGVQNAGEAREIFEALSVAAPALDLARQPTGWFASSPTSPLVLGKDTSEALIFGLEHGFVPTLSSCPMSGATAPFSIIGTVLQQAAENLFMFTAKHAVRPNAAALWGGAGAAMDMRVGDVSYGGIERMLIQLANIDIACRLNVPCYTACGSVDSCIIDAQLGAEKSWSFLTRALSRAATGINIGAITNGKAFSLEQMVIDADLVACMRRLKEGMNVRRLESAAAEILEVAHGGDFMSSPATIEVLRKKKEYFYPATFNRAGTNAPPILRRAHDEVERILAEWKNPVPETIRQSVEKLLG